uniref:RING-type domain-containing protein n=1 Tax=Ananas comosus var. bracteatus TaxID=296719 RepID=A0A6V7P3L2_ANACO|nr:unnamed protein product [Ananas comosus var. bracteatus]
MDSSAAAAAVAARGGRIVLVNTATQAMVMLDADAIPADPPPRRAPSWRAAMRTVAAEAEGEECAVCLEELGSGAGEEVKEVGCGHRFHGGCIERWMGMRATCPVCRARVRVSAEEEEEETMGMGRRRRRVGVWIALAIGR